MNQPDSHEMWQVKMLQPRFIWRTRTPLPADVGEGLCEVMLARANILEDAQFQKIVPNRFVVEISEENYRRHYRPIEKRVLQQWEKLLLEHLTTTNSRQGRKEYRFGGRIQIEIRAAADLQSTQARILSRIQPAEKSQPGAGKTGASFSGAGPCLQAFPGNRRWPLAPVITTLGRDSSCDIFLDDRLIQEKRLVSRQQAYIRQMDQDYRLFDGSPDGKPSVNGTYVNYQRVGYEGYTLRDGDFIILGALQPNDPRPETPGVAAFQIWMHCQE